MMLRLLVYLLPLGLLFACSPLPQKKLIRAFSQAEEKFQDHTGFYIYDPANKTTLYEFQSDRYFTPASNTKILTLFTALTILGDSIPGLRYVEKKDSLIFWGTGDPSFLNNLCYDNTRVYSFLKDTPKPLFFSPSNFFTSHWGPGWAWDDYTDNYSQERSALSLYGNSFSVFPLPDQLLVVPTYFKNFYQQGPAMQEVAVTRAIDSNSFTFSPGIKKTFKEFLIPFHTSPGLVADLLTDTLGRKVSLVNRQIEPAAKTIYSVPADSLYKVMMQDSDNHIAEQLLLMCSAVLSDSLKPEIAIRYMQKNYFNNFPDRLNWKDGSGLSRYNLFTPRSIAMVWEKIYEKVPRERLFSLLASGGRSGTLKNWYREKEPFIFGKTGTLSNNHSLSGFLVTKQGRTLIFSFMNANYTVPVSEIRNNMQRILYLFYENY